MTGGLAPWLFLISRKRLWMYMACVSIGALMAEQLIILMYFFSQSVPLSFIFNQYGFAIMM
jgi:hypothetical protein